MAAFFKRMTAPANLAGLLAVGQAGALAYLTRDPAAIGAAVAGLASVLMTERKP